jgi:calmodulin
MKKNSFPIFVPILILLDVIFSNWINIQKFFSNYWFLLQSQFHSSNPDSAPRTDEKKKDDDDHDLNRNEIEGLLGKLGILCCNSESEFPCRGELIGIFEEKEPSLEEVKEAFDVFDENRDGFIDATELHRVVCILMSSSMELENCKRMITTFDENGDGKIDFNEFLKLMEIDLC